MIWFLRNDDVRGVLDDTLRYLTDNIVKQGLKITHAVEPANVTPKVASWLNNVKALYPGQIEIIQHGYDHQLKTRAPVRGEFGGGRPYEEQLGEIRRGAERMDSLFGGEWTRIFSFPYGAYDLNTLHVLQECGFREISTGMKFTAKRRVLNAAGSFLRRKEMFGRKIVYFNESMPGFNMREIPVVLNNTKKQTGPDSAVQKSKDELMREWKSLPGWLSVRGVLCHHRFNSISDIDALIGFFCALRDAGVENSNLGELHA